MLSEAEQLKLEQLRERRPQLDLTDSEIRELYLLERNTTSRAYSKLVAALSVFPPYLSNRPQLIPAFVEALYEGGKAVFAGVTNRADFWDFLLSKAQVDNDLAAAMQAHPELFEQAAASLAIANDADEQFQK